MALVNGIEHKYHCTIHGVSLQVSQVHITAVLDGQKDGTIRIETADDAHVAAIVALDQSVLESSITNLQFENNDTNGTYTCTGAYTVSDITLALNSYEPSNNLQSWHINLIRAT